MIFKIAESKPRKGKAPAANRCICVCRWFSVAMLGLENTAMEGSSFLDLWYFGGVGGVAGVGLVASCCIHSSGKLLVKTP